MTDGVVELYPGDSVLPLTMEADGVWLQDLWGPKYLLTDDSIITINAILSDPDTTVTEGLDAIGVFSPDEEQSRGEKSVRRGELPDPVQVAGLLRALGRHGFSARETLDNSPTLIKNPENILAQVREAEEKVEIGSNVVITAEMLVAGIIGNRVAVEVTAKSRTLRTLGKPRIQGQKEPKKLSDEVVALLDDPANKKAVDALVEADFEPSNCVMIYHEAFKLLDAKKLVDMYQELSYRLPNQEPEEIKKIALLASKAARQNVTRAIKNTDDFIELAEEYAFDWLGQVKLNPSIFGSKVDTLRKKLELRVAKLGELGLAHGRIFNLLSTGALSLMSSNEHFDFSATVLGCLSPDSLNEPSNGYFQNLMGTRASASDTMYGVLQTRELSKVTLSDLNSTIWNAYEQGQKADDFRDYIEHNRDKFTDSPVHQHLLNLYDRVKAKYNRHKATVAEDD